MISQQGDGFSSGGRILYGDLYRETVHQQRNLFQMSLFNKQFEDRLMMNPGIIEYREFVFSVFQSIQQVIQSAEGMLDITVMKYTAGKQCDA